MSFANNESLADAISLNNKAASYLIGGGEDSAAVEILKQSVDLMTAAVKMDQSCRQGPISSSISCCDDELPVHVFHTATGPLRGMNNTPWFLYNKALYLDMDLISTMSRFPGDVEAMGALPIFNLALVYHRHVLLLGSSKYIEKALSLYSLVLHILGDYSSSSSLTWTTIQLAAINNAAQLRHASGQYQEMAKRLVQLTVVIRRSKESLFPSLLHNQGELRGLLFNLVLLKKRQKLAPAA
jgi:hypothetical protein